MENLGFNPTLKSQPSFRPDIDLLSQALKVDPFPAYAKLRQDRVCLVAGDMYTISTMSDVKKALQLTEIFSSSGYMYMFQPSWISPDCYRDTFVVTQDPPIHDTNRNYINKAFIARIINALMPLIQQTADKLLDQIKVGEPTDFSSAFSWRYVGKIISHITGIDGEQDFDELREWFELMEILSPTRPPDLIASRAEELTRKQLSYYDSVIEDRRKNPREDLISALVNATISGTRLDNQSLRSCVDLLIGAGLGTTVHSLNNSLIQLIDNPGVFEVLKKNPDYVPLYVEEILRFDPATHCLLRRTTQDVRIFGADIPADKMVLIILAAANRDPNIFRDPDKFDIFRPNNRDHLAFGHGVHTCVGLLLARMELTTAISAVVKKFSGVNFSKGYRREYINSLPTHGVSRLSLTFS
jgi:cytochrome P450